MQVTAQHYAHAWFQAIKQANAKQRKDITGKMLYLLRNRGKLSWLSVIVNKIQELENEDAQVVKVQITVAHKVEQKQINQFLKHLLKSKDIQTEINQDPELLGGMIIETKDQRWNISVRKQLEDLDKVLMS